MKMRKFAPKSPTSRNICSHKLGVLRMWLMKCAARPAAFGQVAFGLCLSRRATQMRVITPVNQMPTRK